MIFTRNRTLTLATVLILLVVYSVVVFVIPFNRGGGIWSSYIFTMFALVLTAGVGFYAFDRDEMLSKVYGIPLISVAWRYLVIQLIVGLVFMVLDFIPIQYRYGIAVNTVLLGACLIGLITVDVAKREIERIDEKIKENAKVFFIKSLQADVEGLVVKASDDTVKKGLKDLAETIRYSDPMSNPQLAVMENKIEGKISDLSSAVEIGDDNTSKDLCNELKQLFAERNRKCKLLK